jgi:hypothetical protein
MAGLKGDQLPGVIGFCGGELMAKKTRAVRRGSKRMREETEADEIQVRDPAKKNHRKTSE